MPRPTKYRRVAFFPKTNYFAPSAKGTDVEEITLKVEELEAVRLKDIKGLKQEDCAKEMQVSRQTFQNIIDSARHKIALALTEGKALRITGGHYTTNHCRFMCLECDETYDIQYDQDRNNCPRCSSKKVHCEEKKEFCKKWCHNQQS